MRVLGIETSCDETSVALLKLQMPNAKCQILKHYIAKLMIYINQINYYQHILEQTKINLMDIYKKLMFML